MILLGNCPICSGSNLLKKLDCIDHSTSKKKFIIVSCETCDFTFTNPRPKDNSLGEYTSQTCIFLTLTTPKDSLIGCIILLENMQLEQN
jgi:hypothetical protein